MIQFTSLSGKTAGAQWVARRFPILIGRAPPCLVCLDEDGVWDPHAEVDLVRKDGFTFAVLGEALALINGQPAPQAVLRNGDVIELGSAKLLFTLSPTRQRSLRLREALTWLALAALCLGQAALIYWLVG